VLLVMDDLEHSSVGSMPRMNRLVGDQGLRFANMMVTTPLCAPSRASFLTGQYAHNNGILGNGPPFGAYEIFRDRGYDSANVGPWLNAAGYRTALFGKYMNNFPLGDETLIPPGWDEWFGVLSDRTATNEDYTLNENGTVNIYRGGGGNYQADVLSARLLDFIARTESNDDQPFFAYLGISAPHGPALAAPRHQGMFAGWTAPRGASFNESDLSDKPLWLRNVRPIDDATIAEIDDLYRRRQESLQAVDELIEAMIQALDQSGELDRTWVFITSDNGVFHGQHRLPRGKGVGYEEASCVPLLIRGPGAPVATINDVVANIDFAPTLLELAGTSPPASVDGRSFVAVLRGQPSERTDVLVEGLGSATPSSPPFASVRTATHVYTEYDDGDREMYDLVSDPEQLNNLLRVGGADPALVDELVARLAELRGCAGSGCN
jgi:arylsulfatase A-like enzyme